MRARFVVTKVAGSLATLAFVLVFNFFLFRVVTDDPVGKMFRGRNLSREQIETHLYSELDGPLSNAVDSAICSLRRKVCPPGTPPLIHTRRGLGYVLEA